jgi:hypothetical protein
MQKWLGDAMEKWKPIESASGNLSISNYGNVSVDGKNISVDNLPICTSGYYIIPIRIMGNGKPGFLHRLIFSSFSETATEKEYIDHIDGNKLNNRIDNLRACTRSENGANAIKKCSSSSRYKGVIRIRDDKKRIKSWRAQITSNRKTKILGYFKKEEDAASAYDTAAIETFREYAKTNKMLGLL